jgi:hypothetical protein
MLRFPCRQHPLHQLGIHQNSLFGLNGCWLPVVKVSVPLYL